jgi:hypothetical protein
MRIITAAADLFQGMDTSGKLMEGNSARGVVVHSLKLPIRQSWNTIICGVTILHYLKRKFGI